MAFTTNVRRQASDTAMVLANIGRALKEAKEELGISLKDLEEVIGLDDSTIDKVFNASRNIRLADVEDICHGFNKLCGQERYTAAQFVLKYNTPDDIERELPSKLGFTRFLDRHRQVPEPATPRETAGIKKLVGNKPPSGKMTTIEIPAIVSYTIEQTQTFRRGETYAVRIAGTPRVVKFPFLVEEEDGEFEVLGHVTDARIT